MQTAILVAIILLIVVQLVVWMKLHDRSSRKKGDPEWVDRLGTQWQSALEKWDQSVRSEFARNRTEMTEQVRQLRTDLGTGLRDQRGEQSMLLDRLTTTNEQRLQQLREVIDQRLQWLQEDNGKKLELMRQTVDEKLHATLEQRLGASFKQVSDRLEQVHKGLGEMQTLASGVGDLKRILTNVKTRGTWGEVQLQALLEQVLAPDQFAANVAVNPNSNERVEFAVRLPGKQEQGVDEPVWLPIDAKFPQEDYQRLQDAYDASDAKWIDEAGRALEARVRDEAKTIHSKYVVVPHTTDFAILFLPTEGLYAEIIRRQGLIERLQRDYRIIPAGPTTLMALLNSLQMGFRTLAIEKRSSEVWKVLGAVKTEFGKFSVVLDKVQKKIEQAGNEFQTVTTRTNAIQRQLRQVEALPQDQSIALLQPGEALEMAE